MRVIKMEVIDFRVNDIRVKVNRVKGIRGIDIRPPLLTFKSMIQQSSTLESKYQFSVEAY